MLCRLDYRLYALASLRFGSNNRVLVTDKNIISDKAGATEQVQR